MTGDLPIVNIVVSEEFIAGDGQGDTRAPTCIFTLVHERAPSTAADR